MHTVEVGRVLDALGLDGWTEVRDAVGLVADAVCELPSGRRVYVEVDLTTGDLAEKASRYTRLGGVQLLVVTTKPEVAVKALARLQNVIVVPLDELLHPDMKNAVRAALEGKTA